MNSRRSPQELIALAAEQGIIATLHPAERAMPTVQEAAAALGIPVDTMTKNLIFLVKGEPILVIVRGTSMVDKRTLARHFGVGRKKVKLATAQQTFDTTGFVAGCVPSFGHKTPLPTFIDEDIYQLERVYGGTSEAKVLISIPLNELIRLTKGEVMKVRGVTR